MKKSTTISLVLVTALLGCDRPKEHSRLYLRTDSTGYYTHAHPYGGYYIFRPYGAYYGGRFMRSGYSNAGVHSSISEGISRGGFGESAGGHSVSS